MSELKGKRVWITGASSGIGAALAVECHSRGANLVLSARDAGRLNALRERLEAAADSRGAAGRHTSGGSIAVFPLDVTRPEETASVARQVLAEVGPIDILIHAAGVSQRSSGLETDMKVVRRILETNFFGVVGLTRELLPSMTQRGDGHVVVITSAYGKFGGPGRSSYAASKHALHGFFDSLRTELPKERVRITFIVPGEVATNISANALTADGSRHELLEERIARGMSPQSCARKIVRAIVLNRDEIYVAADLRLRLAFLTKKIAPRLLTRVLRSMAKG